MGKLRTRWMDDVRKYVENRCCTEYHNRRKNTVGWGVKRLSTQCTNPEMVEIGEKIEVRTS